MLGRNKAYSALWFGRDSVEIPKAVGDRGITAYGDPQLTVIGGGVLIKDSHGDVLGAVGMSGRTMQEDIDAATRLVAKIKAKAGV